MESDDKLKLKITELLRAADLETTSAKQIRRQLEAEFSIDLTTRKAEVDSWVLQALEDIDRERNEVATETTKESDSTSVKREAPDNDSEEDAEEKDTQHTPRHKAAKSSKQNGTKRRSGNASKRIKTDETISDETTIEESAAPKNGETDEDYAKRLQQQESRSSLRRRASPRKSTSSTKEAKSTPGSSKRKTGFHQQLALSPALRDVLGAPEMSRPDVVKQLWAYIKSNKLQDPADGRFILCDDRLKTVFNKDRVHSFKMNKFLSSHMTPL